MERIPRGRYTKEFRVEAVKLLLDGGLSQKEASRRLNVSEKTLQNWLRSHRAGKLEGVGKHYRELSAAELELSQLRRELARVKMERDILKKAAAYFAKESQGSTR